MQQRQPSRPVLAALVLATAVGLAAFSAGAWLGSRCEQERKLLLVQSQQHQALRKAVQDTAAPAEPAAAEEPVAAAGGEAAAEAAAAAAAVAAAAAGNSVGPEPTQFQPAFPDAPPRAGGPVSAVQLLREEVDFLRRKVSGSGGQGAVSPMEVGGGGLLVRLVALRVRVEHF